ncbi:MULTISPECIES: ATP-binding protein [Alteromonas]|uniref:histidine kinase n=1 Tax=Alteromonas stellipolaris TaxID=233316 RepID=A0AAW7YYQ1_9ALTE|nr:ATP-binding protein [Alteromonas stellipolaris]ALM91711.1 multi-sensor hybrid histidine kinase [Alteromonas stellipolaris LMG 21856]AMJ73425.1 hybrid sensor histidine kinase/response regulator [Alteromonas stellipolaris]MDO6534315.1 ATP-binding protein [Alteromonas stellipolaris]MDO6576359.1 ATP-binding protein [Alteromonas stellipolaris]MDO6624535.1 ATP-binding protein [Alteromonas stellipolaris]
MQFQPPPLRKRLLTSMLPRLFGLILIVALMLFAFTFFFAKQQIESVQKQSIEGLKQDLSFIVNDTTRQLSDLASNDIIINSLVDLEQRDNYLPMFFRSLKLTQTRNVEFALYDFSGEMVIQKNWSHSISEKLDTAWQQKTLGASLSFSSITQNGVLFSVPVLLSGAAEGALVMYVESLQALLAPYPRLTNQVVTDENGLVLFSSDPEFIIPGTPFSDVDTMGYVLQDSRYQNLTLYSIKPIVNALKGLYWLALLMLAIIIGIILVNFHMIRTTALLAENTLSTLYKDIVNRIKDTDIQEPVIVEEARELANIRSAFDTLISDLAEMSLSNEQFSNVIDSMGDMLLVVDDKHRVMLSNKRFDAFCEDQYGEREGTVKYILNKLINKSSGELKHFSVEDGLEKHIKWTNTPLEDANHNIKGAIFVGVDYSTQRSLESHVQILNHAMDEATVSIVISDIKRTGQPIIYVNNAFHRLTGHSKEDIIGRNCRLMQGEGTDSHATTLIRRAIANREPVETTILNYRKDGTSFYNRLILTPVKSGGEVTHYIGFQQDVTQQRQAERYLQDAKQKAEESAHMKSGFLASMSHEIRTPIHGISGVLQLLSNSPLNDEQKHYLSLANFSIQGLLHIVNDILDFSKIEAGQLQIDDQPFDLLETLESLQSQYAILCQEKGLRLHFHFNLQGFHVVIGDSVRFRQILSNLIGNAVKFTEKGEIDVTTTLEHTNGDKLRLTCAVKDSGIGIAKEKQAGIFEVFTQEDLSTTRKFGGTGLGLSISKQLCELMDGEIRLESEKGEGSTFTFNIILKEGDDSLVAPQLSAAHSHNTAAQKRKILIVEDNDINQVIVKQHLSGHKTLSAKSGIEALEALKKMKVTFDLILMDCQMPDMDGFEATRRIRRGEAGERYVNAPIIALTANAMKGDREDCFNAGMNDYLSKPFDVRDLLEKVNYWAEKSTEAKLQLS